MDFLKQLTDKNYDPTILEGVRNLLEQVKESQQIIAQYEAVITEHETVIARHHAEFLLKDHQLKNSTIKIEKLMLELAHHKRIRFGKKNESLTGEQRRLFEEEWEIDLAALTARLTEEQEKLKAPNEKKKRTRAGRASLPKDLPRVVHRHEPESCQCASCGKDLVKIREDISEQLDVIPRSIYCAPTYSSSICMSLL
jgi:transposase